MIRLPLGLGGLLIGSAALGLGLAPFAELNLVALAAAGIALLLATAGFACWRLELPAGRPLTGASLALFFLLAGLVLGEARLAAIDAGAFEAEIGEKVAFEGYLDAPPRDHGHERRLHLSGTEGKVAVFVARPNPLQAADRPLLPDRPLPVGIGLRVEGRSAEPPGYLAELLKRHGISRVIDAEKIDLAAARGGIAGLLDTIRERAMAGMAAGLPPREAALAAGFVLGQDGAIDSRTEDDFRRAGLAHLVAASGQNVMLLILLGTVPLAIAGVHLRRRMPILIVLVLIYLPLTGAGPSIQRAAVMGIVMLAMIWLGGVGPRLLGLLVAAALTLAADTRASGDVGWQLSFAATVGIMLLAPDLRRLLLNVRVRSGESAVAGPVGRLLADGAAVTVAATLATAPLIAHHFGSLPLASLSANLLALPAVAPAMWLGMIAGIVGQLPGLPTEAINWLNAFLLAYVAEVAAAISGLPGAVAEVELGPGWLVALVEIGLLGSAWLLLRWLGHSASGDPGTPRAGRSRAAQAILFMLGLVILVPVAALVVPAELVSRSGRAPAGLRLVALDVGQGDAILIQLRKTNLLIDTGPAGAGIARDLRRYGVRRLDALFVTHADADHVGALDELVANFEIGHLFHSDPLSPAAGSAALTLAAGQRLRLGEALIEVLWPPRPADAAPADRNSRSLVLLLRWRGFRALLTGDAEAEAAAYVRPGDIDLLKVAHHGSADAALPILLAETTPELALISVGRDNRHGHPHPSTLRALGEAGVSVHRTDQEGDLVLELP